MEKKIINSFLIFPKMDAEAEVTDRIGAFLKHGARFRHWLPANKRDINLARGSSPLWSPVRPFHLKSGTSLAEGHCHSMVSGVSTPESKL
jgi:hypothetical protein